MGDDQVIGAGPRRRGGWKKGRGRKGARRSQRHGRASLEATYQKLGSRAIDPATPVGRMLTEWRAELIEALGGESEVSPQQAILIDLIARDRMIIASVDGWLSEQASLINRKRKAVHPIVEQRGKLVSGLESRLKTLGLERRGRPVQDIQSFLQERAKGAAQDPETLNLEPREPA
jgi:hypothetical protein